MRLRSGVAAALGMITAAAVASSARPVAAKRLMPDQGVRPTSFGLAGVALGGARAPAGVDAAAPAHLAGGTIAALADGALVIDPDSGELVAVDRKGAPTARLAIGPGAAQVVVDRAGNRAYVADRAGDRIVVVDLPALTERTRWSTPAEPFGLALAPDRATLLVTTVAARTLVALDTTTGAPRWTQPVAAEPRGVAIAPDGSQAIVTHLASATVERIDLARPNAAPGAFALSVAARRASGSSGPAPATTIDGGSAGRAFARNAFAARFIGNSLAIVPHQVSVPLQDARFGENRGSYGGGSEPPITHALTFVATADRELPRQVSAQIAMHQPQAVAWDPARDRVAIAGFGSDAIAVIDAASQGAVRHRLDVALGAGCGPQGVAFADDGAALVFCAVARKVARVDLDAARPVARLALGPELTATRLTRVQHQGYDLFRKAGDARISARGSLACASCHPEGRADGLSWRIEGHELQTPLLAGRIAATHPYKWDGGDVDLTDSLTGTMRRLGGGGLRRDEIKALAAFVEALPRPRAPVRDAAQVARGARLFDSAELGCASCHGGRTLTDRQRHRFDGTLVAVDTPSLIGLAASAPYYHDGSAATLEALLADRGLVHGMAELGELTAAQVADLVAFLETL